MGLLFYPRGGSAQVIRYLAASLGRVGWATRLVTGSLGDPGDRRHAETFFAGLDVQAVDYGPAIAEWERGGDPIAAAVPMHPSYEDRPHVPDRVFTEVAPELGEHLASSWAATLEAAVDPSADVLHLHHLTPLHEAASRALPGMPVVTHLHGTELKMAGRIAGLETPWQHGEHWLSQMRRWAADSERLMVISPNDREVAERLLGVEPDQVAWVPNGVDLGRFRRTEVGPAERLARWHRWLVEEPLGWREGGEPGTVRYSEADLDRFVDPETGEPAPVLLFVGRFTEVKRIPLLVRAYARARERFARRAPLVIWGGFPGEWEGEHPHTVVEREGIGDVFFIGWRDHDELPGGLACSDVMVMPSIDESFGQVFVEAMACGVPVIAARAGGPPSFINIDPLRSNGWLVEPDDLDDLATAMVEAVNQPAMRAELARNGYESTRREFSWETIAAQVAGVYEEAMELRRAPS